MAIFKAGSNSDTFATTDLNRDVTSAMIYVEAGGTWRTVGKATSSGSLHAEEWFLTDLKSKSPELAINHGAKVRMEITKSPCGEGGDDHNCAEQLADYMNSSTRKISHLVIRYLGAYNTRSGVGAMFAQAAIGFCASSSNIDIDVWNWKTDSTTAMRAFLIKFKPGKYDTNPETRGDYASAPEKPALIKAWKNYPH